MRYDPTLSAAVAEARARIIVVVLSEVQVVAAISFDTSSRIGPRHLRRLPRHHSSSSIKAFSTLILAGVVGKRRVARRAPWPHVAQIGLDTKLHFVGADRAWIAAGGHAVVDVAGTDERLAPEEERPPRSLHVGASNRGEQADVDFSRILLRVVRLL